MLTIVIFTLLLSQQVVETIAPSTAPVLWFEICDGSSCKNSSFIAIPSGNPIRIRCVREIFRDTAAVRNDPISLLRKTHNSNLSVTLKTETTKSSVLWVAADAQLLDSGVYECISGGFAIPLAVHIYELKNLRNLTIATETHVDTVGSLQLSRRQLQSHSVHPMQSVQWLACTCVVASARVLNMITVSWEGGLFAMTANRTELDLVYVREIERNAGDNSITVRLRPFVPVLDPRIYGEYRCVFSFHQSENVYGTVYMLIAPILRLVYNPPPTPPLNDSNRFVCMHPPCTAPLDENNAVDERLRNWTGACELVVAYPPIHDHGVIWGWTQPSWAQYAITRVSNVGKSVYLSEMAIHSVSEDGEFYNPWHVLERKRRSSATEAIKYHHHNHVALKQPPEPVVFWCWTKNDLGETAVWWPGPDDTITSIFWSSIWWPLLGVTLEFASFVVVFGFFRFCTHKGYRRCPSSYIPAPLNDAASFGLTRLVHVSNCDITNEQQSSSDRVGCSDQQLGVYSRLPSSSPDKPIDQLADDRDSQQGGYINPVAMCDDSVVPPQCLSKTGTDEYFWDSDHDIKLQAPC